MSEDQAPKYVKVRELRPEEYEGTCLRPLGLCDLGGCCDICWYRPDHPRFAEAKEEEEEEGEAETE